MSASVWKLVEIREKDNRCVFTARQLLAELRKPENEGKKIAVLNIVGKFRGGKSYTLNFFLRYLKWKQAGSPASPDWTEMPLKGDGFKFASGRKPETKGIDVWSELILWKKADGEEFLVLLCDTQGLFDNQTEQQGCAGIFAIATLLSSLLIFNQKDPIGSDDLSGLATFAEFACKAIPANQSGGCQLQELMFLVRDCSLSPRYGFEAGGEFLAELEQEATLSEARTVWNVLNRSYAKKSVCLLPPPNNRGAQIGKLEEMGAEFEQHLRQFVEGAVAKLEPKKSGGRAITGGELALTIETLAETFQDGGLPDCGDVLQLLAKSQLDAVVTQLVDEFTPKLQQKCTGRSDFSAVFGELSADALRCFEQAPEWGEASHRAAARKTLEEKLAAAFEPQSRQNDAILEQRAAEERRRQAEAEARRRRRELERLEAERRQREAERRREIERQEQERRRLQQQQLEWQAAEARAKRAADAEQERRRQEELKALQEHNARLQEQYVHQPNGPCTIL